ncbi:MAG: hypothetical protein ACK5II_13075 [Paracoccus sp. (in: a-proteobacteria)]
MKSWLPMIAAGTAALLGGFVALINPTGASMKTVTLVGWALLIVAGLQGWAAWKAESNGPRIRAGVVAGAALFLSLSLLFGNPAESSLIRILVGLLLLGSAAAKVYMTRIMPGAENMPLVLGTAGVSAVLGLLILFGIGMHNFGVLLGLELLASGLALVLLAMYRKTHDAPA